MTEQLHLKYRPKKLDQVVGQDDIVNSLENLLSQYREKIPQSYLFIGPSGVGKTTLARIIATRLHVPTTNIIEVDAATHGGIQEAKVLKDLVSVPAMTKNRKKMLIVDECHALSKQAWQSWLKIVEEPPQHLYLAFCTTEAAKVPKTIETRCHMYLLHSVRYADIVELLLTVSVEEEILLDDKQITILARAADGSIRQALNFLSMCRHCKSSNEIRRVLAAADVGEKSVIEFCRFVTAKDPDFVKAIKLVNQLEDVKAESMRIVINNYAAKVLLNSPDKVHVLDVLEVFDQPFNDSEGKAPLILALGRLCLND